MKSNPNLNLVLESENIRIEPIPDVRVAADVAEDGVHTGQLEAGADDRVVLVGHGVEVGHAAALLQDLVVGRREQAVGEPVPAEDGKEII